MKLGSVFSINEYPLGYKFAIDNGYTIEEVEPKEEWQEKELVKVRYFQIVEIPKPTFDELKIAKREEINQARDAAEQGGFEYMGKIFDSDQVSCIRMMGASQALLSAPPETTITWTCQDNSTINLNGTAFAGLVVALATHSNTCHQKATALKAKIEEAKTKEELDKITWYEEESNISNSTLSEKESEEVI